MSVFKKDKKPIAFFEVFQEERLILQELIPKDWTVEYFSETIQESGLKSLPSRWVCIRTQSRIPSSWLPHTRAILTRSKGYDHLLKLKKDEAFAHDLSLGSLLGYCAQSVAEHAVMTTLALLRKLPAQMQQFTSFDRDHLTGDLLSSQRVVVYGVGEIGYEVYKLCQGLGCSVCGVDPLQNKDDVQYLSLSAAADWADVIICAASLTNTSQAQLSYNLFKIRQRPFVLCNVARAEITPLKDVLLLMDTGLLKGLALDVYEDEFLLAEYLRTKAQVKNPENVIDTKDIDKAKISSALKLMHYPNVIFTPHNAFNTKQSLLKKCQQTVQSWQHFYETGHFLKPVV